MTREEELIELLDKENIADDAIFCEHPFSHSMQEQRNAIEKTFREFGLQGSIVHANCAPQVNCFDFSIGANENPAAYRDIKDNIQMAVGKSEMRMLLPEPGKNDGRLEIANSHRAMVTAEEMFHSAAWRDSHAMLPVMMGKGVDGNTVILDLAKAPHLLIVGCTGSGKSVFMDSCIHSLMFRYTPCELKLILVDSKVVEFSQYNDLPYLQFPVINSTNDTLQALQWLNMEMDRRYKVLSEAGCRDIRTLNDQRPCSLPYIVMIVNEFSDYMTEARTQMESQLARLCAIGRASGIHLIISTSRPDSRVLSRSIMANFPTRIAFRVACHTDSRRILAVDDAEHLLGLGDMLFRGPGSKVLTRIQGVYVNDKEIDRIRERLKSMYGDMKPNALPHLRVMRRNQVDVLHCKLVDIARDVLGNNLDWLKDDIIDDTSDDLADSIIEHWDELKDVISDLDEEPNIDDVEEADSEVDECLSNEDRKLLQEAIQLVIESRRPTISFIQRQLKVGYNKASALLEAMERHGIVSPQKDSAMRSVLVNTYKEALSRLPKQN